MSTNKLFQHTSHCQLTMSQLSSHRSLASSIKCIVINLENELYCCCHKGFFFFVFLLPPIIIRSPCICFLQYGWDVFKPSKPKIKCLRCSLLKSKVKEIPIWFPAFDLMLRKYQGLRRKSIWAAFHESVTVENTCEHLRLRIPTVRFKINLLWA